MNIHEILKYYWGYNAFRPLQEDIIRSVLEGKDTLALMPTGGGKSLTYQVPALVFNGLCIVITPLIALMKDQVEELQKRNIPAGAVYTGMTRNALESEINKAIAGKLKLLYISPERLKSQNFREYLKRMKLSLLAVDEAHCISQWGYDFRPSYLQIAEIRPFFPDVPVLALTATATPDVVQDIQNRLRFKECHVLSKSFRRDNLVYVARMVNDRHGELLHVLSAVKGSAIVYVRKRASAEELAAFLNKNGVKSDFYHAGLSAVQRNLRQETWKKGEVPVIVATNAFGMGIDKPDVRVVLHFDLPDSPEAYFQEAGRAGRDGKRAYAVLLYNNAVLTGLKKRVEKSFPPKKYIQKVYHCLGDFLGVEEGAGEGFAFEFEMDSFARAYKLEPEQTSAALTILQTAGYIEFATNIHARSRITFLVLRDHLTKIDLGGGLFENLVEFILRNYSGIFVQYVFVEEEFLAECLGITREEVYHAFLELAKRRIISYIPGREQPYIIYNQPRVPESYVYIGKEAYEDRKLVLNRKIEAMLQYVEEKNTCRQLSLMKYFGQNEAKPCGVCDNCLERKKKHNTLDNQKIKEEIMLLLQQSDFTIQDLLREMKEDKDTVTRCIRILLDDEQIVYSTPLRLSLNRKKNI